MSIEALNWAFGQPLAPAPKVVLLALADSADGVAFECWPALDYLSERTSLCVRSVRKYVHELESLGLLTIKTRVAANGRQRSNCYRLNVTARPLSAVDNSPDGGQEMPGTRQNMPPRDPADSAGGRRHTHAALEPKELTTALPARAREQRWTPDTQPDGFARLDQTAALANVLIAAGYTPNQVRGNVAGVRMLLAWHDAGVQPAQVEHALQVASFKLGALPTSPTYLREIVLDLVRPGHERPRREAPAHGTNTRDEGRRVVHDIFAAARDLDPGPDPAGDG